MSSRQFVCQKNCKFQREKQTSTNIDTCFKELKNPRRITKVNFTL